MAAPGDDASVARIAQCFADYRQRLGRGERVDPAHYRDELGAAYEGFLVLLQSEPTPTLASGDDGAATNGEEPDGAAETLPRPLGPYTLERRIGRGGMGVVYAARHRELDRRVALKVLFFPHDEVLRERFQREARATAQVRHDHIVEIYEAGEADDKLFYAMSLVEGQPLSDVIEDGPSSDARETCRQFAEVADALHELHQAGVVHRDIKPSNLIYDRKGRLIVADFGLARTGEGGALTATGEALGTPQYMSPEQVTGERDALDGRTDVYGLGATLYETVLGRPPFDGASLGSTLKAVVFDRPPAPTRVDPRVPKSLEWVILKCLEKKPSDRYPSAADLAADLRAFAEGRGVSGRPVSLWKHRLRAAARHPLRLAAGLAVIAGLAAWIATRPGAGPTPTTALLQVQSVAGAVVSMNEGPFAPTPAEWRVEPGTVSLVLRLNGHADRVVPPFEVVAGGQYNREYAGFSILDGDDPIVLASAANARGWSHPLPVDPSRGLPASRAGRKYDVLLLYPRGKVRVEDLQRFRLEVGDDYDGLGHVEFRRGAEVLYRSPAVDKIVLEEPIPAAVREVSAGDTITWGFYPDDGDPITVALEVVGTDLTEARTKLDAELEEEGAAQSASVRAYFRAQLLAREQLWSGALLILEEARKEGVLSRALLRFEGDVLERLFEKRTRTLIKSRLWTDIRTAHVALPRK